MPTAAPAIIVAMPDANAPISTGRSGGSFSQ
jgi:hypothetical protein